MLPLNLLVRNWSQADRSRQHGALESTALSMAGITPDAVVLLTGELQSAALYYWHVLHRQSAPTLVPARLAFTGWCAPLLEPETSAATASVRGLSDDARPAAFAHAIRERLSLPRPFYTNVSLDGAPAGYVLLRDEFMNRLVRFPGLPEAADAPGAQPLLLLSGGAGAILGVAVPPEAERGKPFAITAAIRWAAERRPADDLRLLFSWSDAPRSTVAGGPMGSDRTFEVERVVPALFDAPLPPNRPGRHYEQAVYAIISRNAPAGVWHAWVQVVHAGVQGPAAPAGTIVVR